MSIRNLHIDKREDIVQQEQTIAMSIELNHVVAEFDNDEIKEILSYKSTM